VRKKLFLFALILLPAALLINLGIMVFIDDEAIRSLVAQEMLWSGNYISPEMHGDAYLNKPPLWNWILSISFWMHGGASEWAARLPTVIGLIGFAATTYFFSKKHFPRYLAAIHALTVITCGRMLFWDSMLALIDVTFSWVIYAQIMLLYEHGRKGEWWKAFAWSYGLTAVAFMLKGLPAIVFQGLTVFAILGWTKSWKKFFSPAHILSGLACVGALGLYYWQYSHFVDLSKVAERIFVESGKRTAVAHGWWESLKHIVAFPFEMSYHFMPWTLLLVYLFQRGSWRLLKTNDFAAFALVAFLVNIPIYWLSPNVYPRYLLMLFPLLFASLLFLHSQHKVERSRSFLGLRYVLLGLMALCAAAMFFAPLVPKTEIVSFAWGKSLGLGAVAGAVVVLAWRSERNTLLYFSIFLLLLRVGFNFFVLPPRAAGDERGLAVRNTATAIMEDHPQDSIAIYGYTLIEPATGYYLTQARGRVVPRKWEGFDSSTVYIVAQDQYPRIEDKLTVTDKLYLRHKRMYYTVGKFPTPPKGRARLNGQKRDGMGTGSMSELVDE
jgi:4-amino-4-deoxy-L-arabinose transferase-like glycosyltransferase